MDTNQKILIIGSGGREHAIGWKLKQSPNAGELFFAPGNGGTAEIGTNVDIKATDISKLIEFVKKSNNQKSCPECSIKLERERKKRWKDKK